MTDRPSCRHHRLVTAEHCHVEQCSQGAVHVAIGGLTLRLPASEFVEVATALSIALRRLDLPNGDGAATTRLLC